jgi:hypothetical protein
MGHVARMGEMRNAIYNISVGKPTHKWEDKYRNVS